MEFPVSVQELEDWIPHRYPMVWIDSVLSADAVEGECRVLLKSDAFYQSPHGIRASSIIEWIAQSYAFVRAVQIKTGLVATTAHPKRAFLVAARDARFEPAARRHLLLEGAQSLRVRVRHERDFGAVAMIAGSVHTESGVLLGVAKLKVYAE